MFMRFFVSERRAMHSRTPGGDKQPPRFRPPARLYVPNYIRHDRRYKGTCEPHTFVRGETLNVGCIVAVIHDLSNEA